jgi:class I fructose-bisphosphate aldolase
VKLCCDEIEPFLSSDSLKAPSRRKELGLGFQVSQVLENDGDFRNIIVLRGDENGNLSHRVDFQKFWRAVIAFSRINDFELVGQLKGLKHNVWSQGAGAFGIVELEHKSWLPQATDPLKPKLSSANLGGIMANQLNYEEILGKDAQSLLEHRCKGIPKESIYAASPRWVDEVMVQSDRRPTVLRNLQSLLNHGRLGGTGYTSIFPVDQGIEHSAGASFAPNPVFFDPAKIVEFAIEGGCNGVATTLGVLGLTARKYAHRIPFILKINHNEFLSMPNRYDQTMFATVKQAAEMGCVAIGATIYWGSAESARQLKEVSEAFAAAHELGMGTILWCYTRNNAFKVDGIDYHSSADLTGQANHLGVTLQADIIKQKLPTNNGGYNATKHGKTHPKVYSELTSDNPIDLCRYQLANCYMGKIPLINSGGESKGASDLADAVKTAVINKRAGGMGLIAGRKAFQRPWKEGLALLNAIQDVYLDKRVTIA